MTKIDMKKFKKIDNELTYAVTYRNMYNYAVIVLALWYFATVGSYTNPVLAAIVEAMATIILVMGFKWCFTQIRENLDTLACNKLLEGEKGE